MKYLVGDIGATWARLAVASESTLLAKEVVPLARFGSAVELVRFALTHFDLKEVSGACLAVAGPASEDGISITNGSLEFEADQLTRLLGTHTYLVNDFCALGHAVPHLTNLFRLGGEAEQVRGVKALLGPGTGLGMSILVPVGERDWMVVPSEGGHADLAAGSPLEQELVGVLHSRFEHVCWETVLSGSGLVNLYRAVAAIWGAPAEDLTPEQVSSAGIDISDPMCHQTLELFCGFLGAAAGNLAVTLCAQGGVYLGGGILPHLRDFLAQSAFRRRFEERGAVSQLIQPIPVYLIQDQQPGLLGAWRCLLTRLRQA
ncbi:MAG: glucokinase [Pseudomonadales bacterium]|nr:glucokinase [Pseudomonadales bacterium]MDP6470615.1 glucokinase [Pseudomonadales bacterium]MDP6828530.1 glucokinase [Pseudomonadales bacterium]MDP6973137.1 glucokinase [Pseudomonadales bacterium]